MAIADRLNWDDTGLLIGLSGERRDDCIRAFEQAFHYLVTKQKNDLELEKNVVLKQGLFTMDDLKKFFVQHYYFEGQMELMLFPIIRRVVDRGKSVNFFMLINHIQKKLKNYDVSRISQLSDVEAELCADIADTYN